MFLFVPLSWTINYHVLILSWRSLGNVWTWPYRKCFCGLCQTNTSHASSAFAQLEQWVTKKTIQFPVSGLIHICTYCPISQREFVPYLFTFLWIFPFLFNWADQDEHATPAHHTYQFPISFIPTHLWMNEQNRSDYF